MSDQSTSDGHIDGVSATPPKPAAWWEDFIDIFYAPSAVFARRANASFFLPMLVVTVLIGVIYIANSGAMQPIMDAEFTRSMATAQKSNPSMTAEQMAMGRSIAEKIGKVGAFIFVPIAIFLIGLTLWLVGKIFDAKQAFGAALVVAAFSYVPRVVEAVVAGVQLLLLDPSQLTGRFKLSLGIGRFLDPDGSPLMLALLGRVDVFTIWITILLGIGLAVTGKIPRSKAMIAAAVVWVVGALPGVLGALRQ